MLFNKEIMMKGLSCHITVVFVYKTSSGNKAEILGILGKDFDECIEIMHNKIRDYAQKGNPVINHTIVDINYKE